MKYLANKSHEDEENGNVWRLRTGILFFGSFGFVLVHLLLAFVGTATALWERPGHTAGDSLGTLTLSVFLKHGWYVLRHLPTAEHVWFARLSLVMAAVLPAFVAGVRSYRGSREFERNALRHRATLHSLEKLNDEMVKAKALVEQFDRDEMRKARALAQPVANDEIAKAMDLAEGIEKDEIAKGKVLARQFEIARFCELILEFDTCEFLRLIREMEWYG